MLHICNLYLYVIIFIIRKTLCDCQYDTGKIARLALICIGQHMKTWKQGHVNI